MAIITLVCVSSAFAQDIIPVEDPYEIQDEVCQTYVEWTGTHVDKIDLSILGERPHRVLKPNSMATMDYVPDRLNIMTTEDGIILTQECG